MLPFMLSLIKVWGNISQRPHQPEYLYREQSKYTTQTSQIYQTKHPKPNPKPPILKKRKERVYKKTNSYHSNPSMTQDYTFFTLSDSLNLIVQQSCHSPAGPNKSSQPVN